MKMKRGIIVCLTMICMVSLTVGVTACNEHQADLETEQMLCDDLDSLMFSLEGVIYTLPVHLSELEANSWSLYDPDNLHTTDLLAPGELAYVDLISGNQNAWATVTNLSDEVLPMNENYLTAIAVLFREDMPELYNAQLILSGGITIGSTLEDVYSAYGRRATWMTNFEESDSLKIFYSSNYFGLDITIDTEKNLVAFMNFRYFG
jgi:hypothetical protein